MTNADDSQFVSEELDPDELQGEGDGVAGGSEPEEYPPTHLSGVNAYGITAGEERVDEPIEERESRDSCPTTSPTSSTATSPPTSASGTTPSWARRSVGWSSRAPRTTASTSSTTRPTRWRRSARRDDLTSEESAMHVTEDPPEGGSDHDGYY